MILDCLNQQTPETASTTLFIREIQIINHFSSTRLATLENKYSEIKKCAQGCGETRTFIQTGSAAVENRLAVPQ